MFHIWNPHTIIQVLWFVGYDISTDYVCQLAMLGAHKGLSFHEEMV